MADLARIKNNVAKMVSMGAPESDIDGYIASEGVTIEDVRSYNPNKLTVDKSKLVKPSGDYSEGVAKAAWDGFLEGAKVAGEDFLQGYTLNAYGKLNQLLGGDYYKRSAENQAQAEREGLGGLNSLGRGTAYLYGAVRGLPQKIYSGVTSLGLSGLGALAASGAIEQFLAKGVESERLGDVLPNAISGIPEGAAAGLAGGVVGKGLGGLYNYVRPKATAAREAIGKLRDIVGGDELNRLAQESAATGRTPLELGDVNVLDSAIKAKFDSSQAKKTLTDLAERLSGQQSERNINAINKAFGSKGAVQNADELMTATRQQAQPLYDELSRAGTIDDPRITNLLNDDFIQQEIKAINADKVNDLAIRQAPSNDFRKLDLLKRSLDDKISIAKRAGENNRVRLLEQRRDDLVKPLDELFPQYKAARGVYENQYRILDAQDLGNKALNPSVSVDNLRKQLSKLSGAEKQAVQIGARDKIINDVLGKENQSVAWKKYTNQNAKDKLDLILGKETADDLTKYADNEIKTMRNINRVLGGSQTAEKTAETSLKDVGLKLLKDPLGAAGTIAEQATNPATRAQADYLANVLSESGGETLRRQLLKQSERDELINLLNSLNAFGSTSLVRKLTE